MKRVFDLTVATILLALGLIPLAIVALLVKLTSKGPVLYWADRVGRNNHIFAMPKFRSMRIDTPEVASHLLTAPDQWLTPIGSLLRCTSLDELPQLWNILRGDMSLVGPRPALHNQHDLIAWRTLRGVHEATPGITGWAQINGRDEASIVEKVEFDAEYVRRRSLWFDLKIIVVTARQVVRRQGTSVPDALRGVTEQAVPSEAFLASAAVWFEQGEHEKALRDCNRAIEADSDNAAAYRLRGDVRKARGENDAAQADYDRAIAIDSKDAASKTTPATCMLPTSIPHRTRQARVSDAA